METKLTKTDIFISYKRDDGIYKAISLQNALKNRGYSAIFFDYDSLHSGDFEEQIKYAICNCTDFVVLLTPLVLESCQDEKAYVPREIQWALESNCNIITLNVDGAFVKEWPKNILPSLKRFQRIQMFPLDQKSFNRDVDKLIGELETSPSLQLSPLLAQDEAQLLLGEKLLRTHYIAGLKQMIDNEIHRAFLGRISDDNVSLSDKLIRVGVMECSIDMKERGMEDELSEDEMLNPFTVVENIDKHLFVFCGPSGTGKTTLLIQMLKEDVQKWENLETDNEMEVTQYLPVFLKLNSIKDTSVNLSKYLADSILSHIGISLSVSEEDAVKAYFNKLLEDGRLMIYLDGLDEISHAVIAEAVNSITRFINEKSNCHFFLTTRHTEVALYIERILKITKCEFYYKMCKLNEDQKLQFLKRCSLVFEGNRNWTDLWDFINRRVDLNQFSQNPMHLMMLVSTLSSNIDEERLESISIGCLYQRFANKLMQKNEPQMKNLGIDTILVEKVLKCIAGMIWGNENQNDTISREELSKRIRDILGTDCKPNDVLELIRGMCIINLTNDIIEFSHASFKEYYLALYLKSNLILAKDNEERKSLLVRLGNEAQNLNIMRLIFELFDEDEKNSNHSNGGISSFGASNLVLILLQQSNVCKGLQLQYDEVSGTVRCCMNKDMPVMNPVLPMLANVTSGISSGDASVQMEMGSFVSKKDVKASTYVETFLLNILYLFKVWNPKGIIDKSDVLKYLLGLFESVSLFGSKPLVDELFTPYWLRLWLIHNDDFRTVLGMPYLKEGDKMKKIPPENRTPFTTEQYQLSNILMTHSSNNKYLFDKLLELSRDLKRYELNKSADKIKDCIFTLYQSMSENELKLLYGSTLQVPFFANSLLFYLSDVDFFIDKFNDQQQDFYPRKIVDVFLSKHLGNKKILDFWIGYFNNMHSKLRVHIIRYYLLRRIFNESLLKYLWSHYDTLRLECSYTDLLDIIPLKLIDKSIADTIYDADLYTIQMNLEADKTEGGMDYFVYQGGKDGLKIVVPDIRFVFKGKYLRLPSLDRKSRLLYQVLDEEYASVQYVSAEVACIGSSVALPSYGVIEGIDEEGVQWQVSYVASAIREQGLRIYTFVQSDVHCLMHWRKSGTEVYIAGEPCRITTADMMKSSSYERILTLSETTELPKPVGEFSAHSEAASFHPIRLNETVITPYVCLKDYFQPVQIEQIPKKGALTRKDIYYRLFGYDRKKIYFWTETVDTELMGCICSVVGKEISLSVSRKIKLEEEASFVELTITDVNDIFLPKYGHITLQVSEDETDRIPYVFMSSQGGACRLRVMDRKWVQEFSKADFVEKLIHQEKLFIKKRQIDLSAVNILKHNPQAMLLVAIVSDDNFDLQHVPLEGRLSFINEKTPNGLMLGVKSGMRNLARNIAEMTFAGIFSSQSSLAFHFSGNIVCGQYLSIPSVPQRLMISTYARVYFAFRVALCIMDDISSPCGILSLNVEERIKAQYWLVKTSVAHEYQISMLFTNKSYQKEEILNELNNLKGIGYNQSFTLVERVDSIEDISDQYNYRIQVADRLDKEVGQHMGSATIEFYVPVANYLNSRFVAMAGNSHTFQVNTLSYTRVPEYSDVIFIPRCHTQIANLYFKLNDTDTIHKVQLFEEMKLQLGAALPLIGLKVDRVSLTENPMSGIIQFYSDAEGLKLAFVGLNTLMGLVDLDKAEQYHASVCLLLIDEMRRTRSFNPAVISFIIQRNSAAELLKCVLSLADDERDKVLSLPTMRICVAVIVRVGDTGASVFFPLKQERNEQIALIEDMSSQYSEGDIIVVEHNGKTSKLENPPRLPQFGFLDGLVTTVKPGGDAFIHIKGYYPDFYFNYSDTDYEPKVGDWVNFLPSRNPRGRSSMHPLAIRIKYLDNRSRCGIITDIKQDVDYRNHSRSWVFTIKDVDFGYFSAVKLPIKENDQYYQRVLSKLSINDTVSYVLEDKEYSYSSNCKSFLV